MKSIPAYGMHMTLAEFKECVMQGCFIDYDGYGHYATATEMSEETVVPSSLADDLIKGISWTHVIWFNR